MIGAMALGIYGLPRFTSDIDILVDGDFKDKVMSMMEILGYSCFQKSNNFAQFDSDLGVLGAIDYMFVYTQDGRDILKQSVFIEDKMFGKCHVIQPTDYIILKLMAIANNPERCEQDEADIVIILRSYKKNLIPESFGSIDIGKIYLFAERFGHRNKIEKLLNKNLFNNENS